VGQWAVPRPAGCHDGGMTAAPSLLKTPLETLLAQAHAQPGEPQSRLSMLLSALEDADWTLLLATQEALAAQLVSVLGPGLIRLDPRLSLNRETFAGVGLALASSDGDWKGARAVWLMEPDERSLTRARKADVPLIADATLAPGGRWLTLGAQLVVYRDAATLTGYGDVHLAAVSGLGSRPRRVAAAPADLSVALALRDIGTLALRMNRRTRNTEALLPRFEGRALPVSGGVLLLEHDGPSTVTPLGGNLSAARAVAAGTLVTVGIEAPDDAWAVLGAVLMGEAQPAEIQYEDEHSADGQQRPDGLPREALSQTNLSQPNLSSPKQSSPERVSSERPAARQGREPGQRQPEPRMSAAAAPIQAEASPAEPDQSVSSPSAPAQDFSDREFVFSPPPVLPDLPSLPNLPSIASVPGGLQVNQPGGHQPAASQPGDNQPEDTGRPAPKRNRGRRGKADPVPELVSEPTAPEIVMSESFSRSPEAVQPVQTLAQPDEQPGDGWPEELGGAGRMPDDLLPSEPEAVTVPLQLPPDLPTESGTAVAADLSDEQQAIYARLREWRNAEAKRQGMSSFIIASNATLAEVARSVPYTEADLNAIKGMGPERLRKYGAKILEVVRG
jgi:HRDC domain